MRPATRLDGPCTIVCNGVASDRGSGGKSDTNVLDRMHVLWNSAVYWRRQGKTVMTDTEVYRMAELVDDVSVRRSRTCSSIRGREAM